MPARGSSKRVGDEAAPVQPPLRKNRAARRGVTFGKEMGPTGSQDPRAQRMSPERSALRTGRSSRSSIEPEMDSDVSIDDELTDGEKVDSDDEDMRDSSGEDEAQVPSRHQGMVMGQEPSLPKARSIHSPQDEKRARNMFQTSSKHDISAENNGKDEWLLVGIEELKRKLLSFSSGVPKVAKTNSSYVERLIAPENEQLVRYVGSLSMGGAKGVADWNELLTDAKAREAIVIGVIARALKEHVFGDYLFGAENDFQKALKAIDTNSQTHQGFERTQQRAEMVKGYKMQEDALEHSRRQVQRQLIKLLAPMWVGMDKQNRRVFQMSDGDAEDLYEIVVQAATLAGLIRRAPDVVYYWPPTFKDEEYEPARMEAINLQQMIQDSPYEKKSDGRVERAVLRDKSNPNTEAIVRIVAFPGIVAYRQYGGNLAHNEIVAGEKANSKLPRDVRDRYGQPITAKQGFRSRLVNKSVVHLQWGKQRLLTREAGTSAHLDAVRDGNMDKYKEDSRGFVELYDLWQRKNRSG